jgi:hypothetical protein
MRYNYAMTGLTEQYVDEVVGLVLDGATAFGRR